MKIKDRIKKYLGLDEEGFTPGQYREIAECVELSVRDSDYLALEQKFDALCSLLDIEITEDSVTGKGEAIVSKINDKEALDRQKKIIDKILS